jgi:hypothetical protein
VAGHIAQCDRCRTEWEECRQTWLTLGDAAETVSGEHVRPQVLRRVRQALHWEYVLTAGGWLPAVLAAALGVGLSLVLAVVVPYAWLVSACRESLQLGEGQAAPYVLAGVAYGLPLAAGAWFLRQRVVAGGVIGRLEASLLFLVILAPIVMLSCREFAPVLLGRSSPGSRAAQWPPASAGSAFCESCHGGVRSLEGPTRVRPRAWTPVADVPRAWMTTQCDSIPPPTKREEWNVLVELIRSGQLTRL